MSNQDQDSASGASNRRMTAENIVSSRSYGRRQVLATFGATLLAAGAAVVASRPVAANTPPASPGGPVPLSDASDSDTRTMADAKTNTYNPDRDGSFRDPKSNDSD